MCTPIYVTFLIVFAMHLCFTAQENKPGRRFTKPFLMPLLLLLYLVEADVVSIWVVLALVASTIGDILLLWSDNDSSFAAGLASFLIGHVFYIVAIIQTIDFSVGIPWWFWVSIMLYVAYGWYFHSRIFSDPGKMKVPFIVYGGAISLMSLATLLRACTFSGWGFWLPFIGSLLFIASDSILACNRSRARIPGAELYVMTSYVLAQVFIVIGLLIG
ncbi:MAG: lysoplasmalogenase [Bacillota bacterium]|jgi:uncharacterized membrane protein YhhN|nr:lysoplasmalogenase [Bacillota bacterium]